MLNPEFFSVVMRYWSLHMTPTTVMGIEVDKVTATSVDTWWTGEKCFRSLCTFYASTSQIQVRFYRAYLSSLTR